jgi:hypothetical protein
VSAKESYTQPIHAVWTPSYHWMNYNDVAAETELNHVRLETSDNLRHRIQVATDITGRNEGDGHIKRHTRNTCGTERMYYTTGCQWCELISTVRLVFSAIRRLYDSFCEHTVHLLSFSMLTFSSAMITWLDEFSGVPLLFRTSESRQREETTESAGSLF